LGQGGTTDKMPIRKKLKRKDLRDKLEKTGLWEAAIERREFLSQYGMSKKDSWDILDREYGDVDDSGNGVIRVTIPGIPVYGDEQEAHTEPLEMEPPAPEMLADTEEEEQEGGDEDGLYIDDDTSIIPGGYIDKAISKSKARLKPKTELEILRWVFENMEVRGILPKDAPSPGAYALLKHCRNNVQTKTKFYSDMWSRTIPTKSRLDEEQRKVDDGDKCIMTLDRIIQLSKEAKGEIDVKSLLAPKDEETPDDQPPEPEEETESDVENQDA